MGRLFSSQRDDNQRTELVLSITPRILRNLRRLDASESELWVGTEALPRMRPVGGVRLSVDDAAAVAAAPTAAAQSATTPKPAEASAGLALQWSGPSQVKAGETFVVTLDLKTDQPLRGAPLQLAYSKERLELLSIDEGELFKQGGAQTSFTKAIDAVAGRASAGVLRNQATGATGQGNVLTLRLKALSAGPAELSVIGVEPIGLAGPVAKPAALPALRVQVQ